MASDDEITVNVDIIVHISSITSYHIKDIASIYFQRITLYYQSSGNDPWIVSGDPV